MSRTHTADPPAFTITRLADPAPETTPAFAPAARMRLWRRAVIAIAIGTSPAPVIATATTGHAGWTAALFLADAAALVAAVVSHAHAETEVQYRPEPQPVEVTWVDAHGNTIHYTATPGSRAAA